jgi:hypothetical protein
MLFSEHLSPIFSNKSKSSGEILDYDGDPDECGVDKTPYDIIEHDVTSLAKTNNLPPPDSFDALQVGSER